MKYQTPAAFWEESLPLGNGRIGAVVYGGIRRERIELNEDTLWSGRASDEDGYAIRENINAVRRLIRQGKFAQANRLTDEMTGTHDSQSYQMAGNLYLDFDGGGEDAAEYQRSLDLTTAIAKCSFKRNGVAYARESFVSWPHQVLAMRLTADQPGSIGLRLSMDSQMRFQTRIEGGDYVLDGQCPLCNYSRRPAGQVTWEENGLGGMKYVVKVKVLSKGGKCRADGGALVVDGADEAVVLVAIKTGFQRWNLDPSDDVAAMNAACDKTLAAAARVGWDALKAAHITDYQSLYNRMSLDLGATDDRPTDEILKAGAAAEQSAAMINLVFNFGRYLLISSSRPGTQPANLQGIWNDKVIAPWRSNYTTNINVEMNYWPAETCNLSDCVEPLLTMVKELAESGRRPAKELYNARGWCVHHNSDLWRYPYTGGSKAQHAFWPVGAAWFCQHVYEHFRFNRDPAVLGEFLPIMKDAAAFLLDYMIERPDGLLTTSPSTSPENRFFEPGTQETASVCEGSAMDLIMIRELFENILEAAATLGRRDALIEEIEAAMPRLAMPTIGSDGLLLEFGIEAEEPEPQHRHISHLYGVYPGWMFTPDRLSEYYEATRKSLDYRGDKSTGWAMAWRVAMWARFGDGNRALRVIGNVLNFVDADATKRKPGGGLFANLWGAHPPYQIDGNFGVTAGIGEMIMQSHRNTADGSVLVELLPALPDAWASGSVAGMRARGGLEVSFKWHDGKVTELEITSAYDQSIQLIANGDERSVCLTAGKPLKLTIT